MGVKIRWVGSPTLVAQRHQRVGDRRGHDQQQRRDHGELFVNYGGRTEIAEAARDIAREAAAGKLNPERVTEATISRHLHRPDIPDVDLLLRTSGEQRTSNFMWAGGVRRVHLPGHPVARLDRRDLWAACEEYASRHRRFGTA